MSGIIFLDLNFFFSEFKLLLYYLLPLTEYYSNLEPDTVPPWKEPGFLLVFSLSLNFNNLSSIVSLCFLLLKGTVEAYLLQTFSSVQNCPRTFSLPLSCWRQCACLLWARSFDGHGFLTFHMIQEQEGGNCHSNNLYWEPWSTMTDM